MSNKGTAASLRDRWLGIHNSYKKKEADQQQQQQHLQMLQKFHQRQQQYHERHNESQRRRAVQPPPPPQKQHWDLRPFGVNWEDQDDEDSAGPPPLLRSWQNTDDWLPPPKQLQHPPRPPPPPPPPTTLFPLTPRQQQQQQQQLASIHRSQRISELAAMLTTSQGESYSSARLKHSNQTPSLLDSNQEDLFQIKSEEPFETMDDDEDDDEHDDDDNDHHHTGRDHHAIESPPPAANNTETSLGIRSKMQVMDLSQHRIIFQLAPVHSRLQPLQQEQQQPPVSKPTTTSANTIMIKHAMSSKLPSKITNPPPKSNKPSPFSYPTYWSDHEGRKLDIYQRSMLRLQEREKRLEQRRQELAKENCTFAPQLSGAGQTNAVPATPSATNTPEANANSTTTPPASTTATTPTTTETTTTTSSSTSTTTASKATAISPAPSRETVFERLYRQQTKQKTTRPVRNVPPATTTTKNYTYSWTSNSISRPGTDGNNSWVSSSMSSKIDYMDGTTRRSNTGTSGTRSDTEAKLLRRRKLEERETAECTFHPRLKWGKEPKGLKTTPTKTTHNVSPLSDGEASKETMTRRSIQIRSRQVPPPPVKRLPREIVTTTVPSHPTAQSTKQGRAAQTFRPPVVSPLRDPPVTMQRRRVESVATAVPSQSTTQSTKPGRAAQTVHPPVVSPLRDPLAMQQRRVAELTGDRGILPVSPLQVFSQKKFTEPNKPSGKMAHRPAVTSPLRSTVQSNKVIRQSNVDDGIRNCTPFVSPIRDSSTTVEQKRSIVSKKTSENVSHPHIISPLRGFPLALEQQQTTLLECKQMAQSSKWVGGASDPPPVASPRYDSPMTIERKKAIGVRRNVNVTAPHLPVVSQIQASPKSLEQNKTSESTKIGVAHFRNATVKSSALRNLPVLSLEQNKTDEANSKGGGGSQHAPRMNVSGTSAVQKRNKALELKQINSGGHDDVPTKNQVSASAALDKANVKESRQKGMDHPQASRTKRTTKLADLIRKTVNKQHHQYQAGSLRESPKRREQARNQPPPPPPPVDYDDVAISPPVLARRLAQTYPFLPVMDVPRVIYSESLASESVVSGRTVDTEYGSI